MSIILKKATVSLSNGSSFTIYSNLEDQLTVAAEAWILRTNVLDAQSFCDYVNNKRLQGLGSFIAITQERWTEMQHEIEQEKNQSK